MSRPLVIPKLFTGEGSWDQWIFHFENIAEVNKWTAAGKLQWLKVRLAGCAAQAALQWFSAEDAADYSSVKERPQKQFEPSCRKERHRAELQTVRRKKDEGWADVAENWPTRVTLIWKKRPKNTSLLIINVFVSRIDYPQVAFSVKQKRPASLDEAVSATLEMECYVHCKCRGKEHCSC